MLLLDLKVNTFLNYSCSKCYWSDVWCVLKLMFIVFLILMLLNSIHCFLELNIMKLLYSEVGLPCISFSILSCHYWLYILTILFFPHPCDHFKLSDTTVDNWFHHWRELKRLTIQKTELFPHSWSLLEKGNTLLELLFNSLSISPEINLHQHNFFIY